MVLKRIAQPFKSMNVSWLFREKAHKVKMKAVLRKMSAAPGEANWWVQGDTPVRSDSQVAFLVDGRHAMWTMCLHFLKARRSIHLANWGLTASMLMVRGADHRAGPDGSPEQNALIQELQAAGLSAQDIQFWCSHDLSMQNVLGYAVSKGVAVKVLLWACPEIASHYSPKEAHEQLIAVGVHCLLDGSASRLPHPSESLHQKISVVDSHYAFVGGIDPLIELNGDFDRWDTPWHDLAARLRSNPKDTDPHSWHDAHTLIEGTAVQDVEWNFYQRWNETVRHGNLPEVELVPEPPRQAHTQASQSAYPVQVARTIPRNTYEFAPKGIQGIFFLYANALDHARQFVYLENQYFWIHTFLGLGITDFGPRNFEMEHNVDLLAQSLEQGASVMIVLPDHPNVGRSFTDTGLNYLREQAPQANAAGRIQAFCLATSAQNNGQVKYRPVYVHAKVALIDDTWATIGSANLNNRGMRDDAEMNVAVLQDDFAHDLRILLWAEHLGWLEEDDQFRVARYLNHQPQRADNNERAAALWQEIVNKLDDPAAGLSLFTQAAQANLQHFQKGEPLVGHLFPYLTANEAKQLKLPFHETHGLFETPEDVSKPK